MKSPTRRVGIALIAGLAVVAISIPVLAASPSPAAAAGGCYAVTGRGTEQAAKPDKSAKPDKGPETAVTLKGTVQKVDRRQRSPDLHDDSGRQDLDASRRDHRGSGATRTRWRPSSASRSRSSERPAPVTPRSMSRRSMGRRFASRGSHRGQAGHGGRQDAPRLEGLDGRRQARQRPRSGERARSDQEGVASSLTRWHRAGAAMWDSAGHPDSSSGRRASLPRVRGRSTARS